MIEKESISKAYIPLDGFLVALGQIPPYVLRYELFISFFHHQKY